MMYESFLAFSKFLFMKRALIASLAISISMAPVGVFLIQRRMSLMGEALSHGILPGIAVMSLFFGFSLPWLALGGIIAGFLVAWLSYGVKKTLKIPEDASFSSFYLLALAFGVFILTIYGGNLHVMHLLFGNILAVDQQALLFIGITVTVTLLLLGLFFRPLVYECFDPLYMRSIGAKINLYNILFLFTVVINLVAACQGLGTLMALGLMMIPAVTAQILCQHIFSMVLTAMLLSVSSSFFGLFFSYHFNWPSGPLIVLAAGFFYLVSFFFRFFINSRHNIKTFSSRP